MNVKQLYLWEQDRYLKFARQVFEDEPSIEYVNHILFEDTRKIPAYCYYYEQDGQIISSLILTMSRQNIYGHYYDVPRFHLTGTLPEYRNHGYMDSLMQACLSKLKKESLFITYLTGLPHFYQQFGFSYGVPSSKQSCFLYKTSNASTLPCNSNFVKQEHLTDEQLAQMIALYETESLNHFGSERRTISSLRAKFEKIHNNLSVYILQKKGQNSIQGYALIEQSDQFFHIIELIGIDQESYEEMIGSVAHICPHDTMAFTLPSDSVARTILGYDDQTTDIHERNASCSLYRILNYENAISVILPTLYLRLHRTSFATHNGCYNIHIDEDTIAIEIKNGVIGLSFKQGEDIFFTKEQFVELYTGFTSFSSMAESITYGSKETKELFSILFPQGSPYIYPLDL